MRSKLGTSLGYWELLEGRLNTVVFLLVGIGGDRPQKLCPSSGGAAGQLRCFQNKIAITDHEAAPRRTSQVPAAMQTKRTLRPAARA